jgi:hypothetical protein
MSLLALVHKNEKRIEKSVPGKIIMLLIKKENNA